MNNDDKQVGLFQSLEAYWAARTQRLAAEIKLDATLINKISGPDSSNHELLVRELRGQHTIALMREVSEAYRAISNLVIHRR